MKEGFGVFVRFIGVERDFGQQLFHRDGHEGKAQALLHRLAVVIAGDQPVRRLPDAAQLLSPQGGQRPVGMKEQADLIGHLADIAVQDLALAAMLAQVAQDFHGRGQGIGFPAGQDVAAPGLQPLKHLEEISFAAAGGHVQKGELLRQVFVQRAVDEGLTQRGGQRADIPVDMLLGHLGQWASDLIKLDHRMIPPAKHVLHQFHCTINENRFLLVQSKTDTGPGGFSRRGRLPS